MKETAKTVLLRAKIGTLSVIDFETGAPFGALVNVATNEGGMPLFLFSKLARHTKSLQANPFASLLVSELPMEGDALTGFRATFVGPVAEVEVDPTLYLAKHPYAEMYAGFGDFGFWQMTPDKIYVVAGFGRIQNFDWAD